MCSSDLANSIWSALKKAIEEIQNGNASKLRFEELYRYTAHAACMGDELLRFALQKRVHACAAQARRPFVSRSGCPSRHPSSLRSCVTTRRLRMRHKQGQASPNSPLFADILARILQQLMETASIVTGAQETLLEVVVAQWENHKTMMGMIRDILMYMVRAVP